MRIKSNVDELFKIAQINKNRLSGHKQNTIQPNLNTNFSEYMTSCNVETEVNSITPIWDDKSPFEPVCQNNEINIAPDTIFGLGNINGKEIKMRVFPEGGYETSSNPRIFSYGPDEGGIPVSEYDRKAFAIFDSFSRAEHQLIDKVSSTLQNLFSVTKGKLNEGGFNSSLKIGNRTDLSLGKVLQIIGIDPAKEFKVNGISFLVENDMLKIKTTF